MEDAGVGCCADGAGGGDTRVAICIPSYRRPRGLFALLGALQSLDLGDEPPSVRVIVVDNDAAGSAREICEDARRWLRYELVYRVEKRKGIPQARNAAVAAALTWADWIAFIDDDELPDPDWLARLLSRQRATGAAAVTGPVLPAFAEEPPRWVREGEFFCPPRFETGSRRPVAFTNNVLVSARALAGLESLFDERFSFGVGEDTELFERIARAGDSIVWADDAVVREIVPAERASVRWIAARGFRNGTACTYMERLHGTRSLAWILAHLGWCLVKGVALAALSPRLHQRVEGLRLVSFAAGRVAGLSGVR